MTHTGSRQRVGVLELRCESLTHIAGALRTSPESWTSGTGLGLGRASAELASAARQASGHPPETEAFFSKSRLFKIMILFLLSEK